MESKMGLKTAGIGPNERRDKPITRDMITAPVTIAPTDGNVRIVCTSPIEIVTDAYRPILDQYTSDLAAMLKDGVSHPMNTDDARVPRGKTLGEIQARAASDLISNAQTMACACDGVRAVFTFMNGPDGLFGEASGPRKVARCVVRPVANDFAPGCNATAFVMESAEFLGMSSLHGMFHMAILSLVNAMVPSDDIMINVFFQGGQSTGKSYVFGLTVKLAIPRTITNEQHETTQAGFDESGNRSMEVRLFQEFDGGLSSTTGGYGNKGDRGTTKQTERLKQTLSDHTSTSRTAVCESGIRSLRVVEKRTFVVYWWASNIPASMFPTALISRIDVQTASTTHRDGLTIPNYTAWGKGPSHRDDSIFNSLKMYVQQLQAFAGLLGNLIFAEIVKGIDMTAFSQVSFRMNEHLHITGGEMQPRTVDRAKQIASTLVYSQIFYSEFCQEDGMFSDGAECSVQDLFIGYRARVLHASLVVSESIAKTAMMHAYDGRMGDEVTAVCKAILYMVCNDPSHPSPYRQMFVDHTESPTQEANRRSNPADTPPRIIDLNYMRIYVGTSTDKRSDPRMHSYCTRLMQVMKLTQKTALSADQIRCTLESMTDPEREWATCKHYELDMLCPSDNQMDPTGWDSTPTLGQASETLYSTLQADARDKMRVEGVPMDVVDAAQATWTRMGGGAHSMYFPYITGGGNVVHSKSCDLSKVADTGYMILSTATVLTQAQRMVGDTSSPFKWMSSSNTINGMPAVRSVTPSPASYGAQTPHLPPTGRHELRPDQVNRMNNPYYCSADTWWRRTGSYDVPRGRSERTIMIPPFHTMDGFVVGKRCEELAVNDPSMQPAVYILFMADPSAANAIVGPGLLDILCGTTCEFLSLTSEEQREKAKKLIEADYLDLVRPVFKDGDAWTSLPEEAGQSADEFSYRATNKLVSLVVGLSATKGVGRMRENMVGMKAGACDGDDGYTFQDADMDNETRTRTRRVISAGINKMRAEDKRRENNIREECRAHTAAADGCKFSSFIHEFRTIDRPREQTLVGYMEIVRKSAADMHTRQYNRTETLRKSEHEASQPFVPPAPAKKVFVPSRKRKRLVQPDRQRNIQPDPSKSPPSASPSAQAPDEPSFDDNMLEFDPDAIALNFPPEQDALVVY